ncbi:MAG: carbohydrate ABC transporter permease, partial [Butyrivibrio sp.]|nr:carbohydrate ABC transporter permease [Butyrivibrio sp.]
METLNERAARNAKIAGVLKVILLLVLFIAFIFPFFLVIVNVFKVKADITSDPLALVGSRGFTLQNFPNAMQKMNFWRSFGNSAIITVLSTFFTILLAAMAAYVIVRNNW